MQVNNSQCFLSGFNKNLTCQKSSGSVTLPWLLIVPIFPAQDKNFLQYLLTCIWGGRMFSQVSLSYVGVFFPTDCPSMGACREESEQ